MNTFGSKTQSLGRLLGGVLQLSTGVFVGEGGPTNLNDSRISIIKEGADFDSVLSAAFRAGQISYRTGDPTVRLVPVFEQTETAPGTPERIAEMQNICAPVPEGAQRVFIISNTEGSFFRTTDPKKMGHVITETLIDAERFVSQMGARMALNRFLMSPGAFGVYDRFGVGCALVWPATPGTTTKKLVLG